MGERERWGRKRDGDKGKERGREADREEKGGGGDRKRGGDVGNKKGRETQGGEDRRREGASKKDGEKGKNSKRETE